MSHQESNVDTTTFVDTFHVIAFPIGNSQADYHRFQTRLDQQEVVRFRDIRMYPLSVGNMVKRVLSWQQQNVGSSWAIRFRSKGVAVTDKSPIFYHCLKNTLERNGNNSDNNIAEQMIETEQLIEKSPTEHDLVEAEQSIKQDGLQQVSAGVITFEIHFHNRILSGGRMSQRFLSVFNQLMYFYYKKREKFFPSYLKMHRRRKAIAEANYALNINNMYDQLEDYTSQRPVPDNLHPPLNVTLRPYQQRSLQFCLDVENKTDELWLPFDDGRMFYSPHFMLFSNSKYEMSGGFLCDEMGLGKTIVSLGLITLRPPMSDFSSLTQHGNTLVVCPVSLVSQWVKEAKKHISANVKIYLHHGSNRLTSRNLERIASNDIVVTTYGVLSRDTSLYSDVQPRQGSLDRIQWWRVIFDESHILKNVNTQQYKACMHIKAKHRWVVTGTPSGNEGQIYAQINLISKYLRRFVSGYFVYGSYTDPIFTILSAFMIRHRKNMTIDGAPILELPECTVNNCYIDLTEPERESYNQAAAQARVMLPFTVGISAFREIQNVRRSLSCANVNTSQSAMQMRTLNDMEREEAENRLQADTCPICLDVHDVAVMTECKHLFCYQCITNVINMSSRQHPPCPMCRRGIHRGDLRLVHALGETGQSQSCSGKLERIQSLLQETESTDKFLIFVQFQQTLCVTRSMLNAQNIKFGEIHGSMSQRAREKALDSFESDPEMRVFLLSTRSGAVGINLTSANHVILFEPFLSRNVEKQAIGRVWRMGQPRPVQVHRLLTRHTIEERIVDQQARQEMESETWSHESIRQLLE